MAPILSPLPLVARTEEVEQIRTLLARVGSGHGDVLIFRGDSGVGKSRLLQHAAEEAERRGWRCATGRSYPVESGIPYALFADALLPLVRSLDAAEMSAVAGDDSGLDYLVPSRARRSPPADVRDDPAEVRLRLLWRFTEMLGTLAERQPLLLVLDDLQWADASSLELLHFVARQISDRPIGLLCAFNPEAENQNPQLAAVRRSLVSGGGARVHTVGPLSSHETAQLIRHAFSADEAATSQFSALLYGWTRGNAFFLEETLKSLVQSGRLVREDGSWRGWDLEAIALPQTVREAVLSRFLRLPPPARELAEILAVIGTSISHEVLLGVSGADEVEMVRAIEELRLRRIVEERMDGDALTYDFTHPVLRETLYSDLGLARTRMLHTRVGEALERWYGDDAPAHAGTLAYHFSRTAGRDLTPRAVRYLAIAGRDALDRFANREAADYLGAAVARGGDAAAGDWNLLENLARARQRLGQFREAAELAEALRDRAVEDGDARRVARAERRLGAIAYRSGDHPVALERLGSAVEWAVRAEDDELRAGLRLTEAECLLQLGRATEAGERIHEALEIAERSGGMPLLARVHLSLLFLHAWTGPPERARAEGERVVSLATDLRDPALLCTAHWGLTILAGLTGDPGAAAEHGEASARLAEQIGSPLHRLRCAELEIEWLTNAGRWEEALSLGERTIASARGLNQRALLPRVLVSTALVHLGRGALDRGRRLLDEAWSLSGADRTEGPLDVHTVVPAYEGRTAYHLWAGEMEEAVRFGTAGLAISDRTGYTAWGIHRLLPLLTEAYLSMGDLENAKRMGERLHRDAERLGHRLGLAWAEVCDAVLVWLQGDIGTGTVRLRAAAQRLEAVPAVPDAARLRRHIAARLRDLGRRDEALQELRHIHDVFVRLGAERELAKTREQIRELGARPPVRETATGFGGLSGREAEIARLVAELKSNKAIARELDISARTVSTHLSNIFRKLEIGSRAELSERLRDMQMMEMGPEAGATRVAD